MFVLTLNGRMKEKTLRFLRKAVTVVVEFRHTRYRPAATFGTYRRIPLHTAGNDTGNRSDRRALALRSAVAQAWWTNTPARISRIRPPPPPPGRSPLAFFCTGLHVPGTLMVGHVGLHAA